MRRKVSIALILLNLQGCASTPENAKLGGVSSLSENDIYNANIAFCEASRHFEYITQFVGVDRKSPPEVRQKEKDESWSEWLIKLDKAKSEFRGKLFYFDIPTEFSEYDKHTNSKKMVSRTHFNSSEGRLETGIPNRVFFTVLNQKIGEVLNPLPRGSKSEWARRNFGTNQNDSSQYMLIKRALNNDTVEYTGFSLNHSPFLTPDYKLILLLDNSRLKLNEGNLIYRKGKDTYLDINKFNFVDAFGVYPDVGNVKVNLRYIFSIESCEGSTPIATLKEIVLNSIIPSDSIASPKEIGRILM